MTTISSTEKNDNYDIYPNNIVRHWNSYHLFQRPRKPPNNKLQADSNDFEKSRPPYWIRHFGFFKSDSRFVISDPENP